MAAFEKPTSPEDNPPSLADDIKNQLAAADIGFTFSHKEALKAEAEQSPVGESFTITFPEDVPTDSLAVIDDAVIQHYQRNTDFAVKTDPEKHNTRTREFTFSFASYHGSEVRMEVTRELGRNNKQVHIDATYREP